MARLPGRTACRAAATALLDEYLAAIKLGTWRSRPAAAVGLAGKVA